MYPFLNLQPHTKKFKTIMADPPWPVTQIKNSKTKELDYPIMTIAEIAALPVKEIADENCRLFLWTTGAMLPEAMGILRIWQFRYRMTYTWVKTWGMGRTPLNSSEFCLLATRGQPKTPCCKGETILNWMDAPKQSRHSQKPKEIIDVFEKISPSPRVELFARDRKEGWSSWGSDLGDQRFNQSTEE